MTAEQFKRAKRVHTPAGHLKSASVGAQVEMGGTPSMVNYVKSHAQVNLGRRHTNLTKVRETNTYE